MSRHLLDPELAAGLESLPPFEEISLETLPKMRAMMAELARTQIADIPQDGVSFSECQLPTSQDAVGVRALIYRPADSKKFLPAVLHIHGGGLVAGIPEIRHAGSLNLVRLFHTLVVSIDYRLAPETPFPGAIEDCYAALRWLHENADSLGVDPSRIVVAGESAGGGLAAALAILARDRGELPIAAQILVYPMLDDRTCSIPDREHAGKFVWTRNNNLVGWSSYLARAPGGPDVEAYAAPARCENLVGLPPAFIACGALDLFLEEDLEYARQLIRAGVPTELHVYPGAFHAFDLVADARISKQFRRDLHGAFEKALRAPA
jgi:triacylglycerol lipase